MSDEKLDAVIEALKEQRADIKELSETAARIDERTEQHEKRMDRMDRKAGVTGSVTGGTAAALIVAIKHMLGVGVE